MNIIEIARQAGFIVDRDSQKYQQQCIQSTHSLIDEPLKKFAELVAAHTLMNIDPKSFMTWHEGFDAGAAKEREECAKMVDHILKEGGGTYGDAIRARSKA